MTTIMQAMVSHLHHTPEGTAYPLEHETDHMLHYVDPRCQMIKLSQSSSALTERFYVESPGIQIFSKTNQNLD